MKDEKTLEETLEKLVTNLTWGLGSCIGGAIGGVSGGVFQGLKGAVSLTHFAPTTMRKFISREIERAKKTEEKKENPSPDHSTPRCYKGIVNSYVCGYAGSYYLSSIIGFCNIINYYLIPLTKEGFNKKDLLTLSVPIITNFASVFYEWQRSAKK